MSFGREIFALFLLNIFFFLPVLSIEYDKNDDAWAAWDSADEWDEGGDSPLEEPAAKYAPPAKKPNIVFILVDDWGWNDVGYHNPLIKTPHIDALANTGLKLEQTYVNAYCTPSRSALMTGMFAHHVGRQRWFFETHSLGGLTLERKILPQYMKELNYSTHIVGKWHLGHCNPAYLPTNRGFDSQYGIMLHGGFNYAHVDISKPNAYDFFEDDKPKRGLDVMNAFQMDLYRERAIKLIKEHAENASQDDEKPMFLYLAFTSNHIPVEAPTKYLDMYPEVDDSQLRRTYMAMTTHMDEVVGDVVDALDETGLRDNSIIVVMSDNGAYSHKWAWLPYYGGGSNDPLRGQKGTDFEGGTRVPALINSPLLRKTGLTKRMVHMTDWLPTLMTAGGGDSKDYPELETIDGKDQYHSLFCGQAPVRNSFVYNMIQVQLPNKGDTSTIPFIMGAIRYGRWKLLNFDEKPKPLLPLGTFQLFDLQEDPTESEDLFGARPGVATKMVELFKEAASSISPEDDPGKVPNDRLAIVTDNTGNQNTNFCQLDGNMNQELLDAYDWKKIV